MVKLVGGRVDWRLQYPISRPFTLPYFTKIYVTWTIVTSAIIILFSFGGTGYEAIPFQSTDFNRTVQLWYNRIINETSWVPKSRKCDPSLIQVGDGSSLSFSAYKSSLEDTTWNEPFQNVRLP